MRVLFIYPNSEGYPSPPLSIAQLSSLLKYYNHEVDILDFTFVVSEFLDDKARKQINVISAIDCEICYGKFEKKDYKKEIIKKMEEFNPEVIAITILENNYWFTKKIVSFIRKQYSKKIKIIVGGIFPTMASNFFENSKIDAICVGEGERGIVQYMEYLEGKRKSDNVNNFLIKEKNEWIKNKCGDFYQWEENEFIDFDIFDERHFLKMFIGKIWKTGFFELSRGCPFKCAFCNNDTMMKLYKENGLSHYRREKDINFAIEEMKYYKEKYNLELVFFQDENFLMMNKDRFDKFCDLWKEKINLPFFMQTKAESLMNEERVKRLKEVGCITVMIGLESGNEDVRINFLRKTTKDEYYKKAIELCNKYDLRSTFSVILGLPYEKEEHILDTVKLCKDVKVSSLVMSIFAPYYGTYLREKCVQDKLLEDKYDKNISMNFKSIIKNVHMTKKKLDYYYNNLSKLIFEN